uniref:Fibrinogen C-terminal domain-containing protein n=1 Tax=Anopheles dirus TaxID=7168 RepID=A0A182N964_9DIPT
MKTFEERITSQMTENFNECQATLAKVSRMVTKTSSGVYVANVTDYKNINYTFNVFRDGSHNHGFGGNWTVFQRRFDGSVHFNRSWAEYRDGFGDVRGEHWLGLEKVKFLLDSGRHELLVVLEDFEGVIAYAKYDNFMLGSEAESYKIKSLGNYRGNAGDALRIHDKQKFATYDKNDDDHCAKLYSSGGWYYSCYSM